MDTEKTEVVETEKPKTAKSKPITHPRYPIGTWKMPGPSGAYGDAPKRGEMIGGLQKKKGGKKG